MRRSTLLMAAARELPSGYTRLEYLESTGTQYIDTGLEAIVTHKLSVTICGTDTTIGNRNVAGAGQGGNPFDITSFSSANKYGGRFGGQSTGGVIPYVQYEVHMLSIWNGGFSCDGVIYPLATVQSVVSGFNMQLFTQKAYFGVMLLRLYGAKIWDSHVLVRNMIPTLRVSDSKPGLWDTVSKQFFTNAGTGEFSYA